MIKWLKKYKNSLKFRVPGILCLICLPVIILLFGINAVSVDLIQKKIYEGSMDLLGMNMKQMDAELEDVSEALRGEQGGISGLENFSSLDAFEQYNSAILFRTQMENFIYRYQYVDNFVCYSPVNDKYFYQFTVNSRDFQLRQSVVDHIRKNPEEFYGNGERWINREIEGTNILICSFGNEENILCAWTSYESLLRMTKDWKLSEGSYLCIASAEGQIYTELPLDFEELALKKEEDNYYFAGGHDQYLVTKVDSGIGDFQMVNIIDRQNLLGTFYGIRIGSVMVLALFLVVLLPYLMRFLYQYVFWPIGQMEEGMNRIESGDLKARVLCGNTSTEMKHLIDSFNSMVEQIETLKMQNYEEQMEKQELMLDYMSLQIEPHFYLNALNLINTMAQMQDTDLIRKLTENLSLYLRYITSSRNSAVTIGQELEHIQHYIGIMTIRFGDCFRYEKEAGEDVLDFLIPPLLIQMVVENSMKYAFDIYGDTKICVTVKKSDTEIVIQIKDNGNGYSQEVLERFARNVPLEGNHIGLWNAKMRLAYMYPNRSEFLLSNGDPCGAVTTIRIKLEEKQADEAVDRR